MFLLVAFLAMLAPAPAPVLGLEKIKDTNQLVWDPSFQQELARFMLAAGRHRFKHARDPRALEPSVLELLSGPPDPKARTPGGRYLFTACRQHSCPEKGGVVLGPEGRIIAIAAISYSDPYSTRKKLRSPKLYIWVNDASNGAVDAAGTLARWGMSARSPISSSKPIVTHFSG